MELLWCVNDTYLKTKDVMPSGLIEVIMKKWIVTLLVMIGMISMIACSDISKNAKKMYIEPAQLTEEEEKIVALLGLNTEHCIFDFSLDESVQSIQVNTYRLVDGEWKLETGGGNLDEEEEIWSI